MSNSRLVDNYLLEGRRNEGRKEREGGGEGRRKGKKEGRKGEAERERGRDGGGKTNCQVDKRLFSHREAIRSLNDIVGAMDRTREADPVTSLEGSPAPAV